MAHIVHRRLADPSQVEPRGTAALMASLSWVGALSVFGGVFAAIVGLGMLVLVQSGPQTPLSIAYGIVSALGTAATIGLVGALELGFPRVRRLNRRLWWGTVLVAVSAALTVGLSALGPLIGSTPDLLVSGGYLVLAIAVRLAELVGAVLLGVGLARAGARPPSWLVFGLAGLGAAIFVYVFRDALGFDPTAGGWWLQLGQVALLWVVPIFVWIVVGVRLMAGAVMRLVPWAAWAAGALAGAVFVMTWVFNAAMVDMLQIRPLTIVVAFGQPLTWVLLLAALALGLGRGTRRRRVRPRRLRLYVLDPVE